MPSHTGKNIRPYVRRPRAPRLFNELETWLFKAIEQGDDIPSGTDSLEIRNALTRLRRNDWIDNIGSKTKPNWVVYRDSEDRRIDALNEEKQSNDDLIREYDSKIRSLRSRNRHITQELNKEH